MFSSDYKPLKTGDISEIKQFPKIALIYTYLISGKEINSVIID